ncbi:MAG: cytochrome c [Anaerolineales bacterium]|nr:cytochrome c [Anaerolineales bacterium]
MKLRHAILFAASAILLAACNFTLAADVTPPPGYVTPTPIATLGPLFPASAPDTSNGEAIYAEKCAPCHGTSGMGDGPQSASLPNSVAALGLADIADKAAPATWFTVVTQGNLEKFMPPFNSLSDQERWDVVSYALTLHTTPEQIEAGKTLFDANCDASCAKKFSNAEMMSALSENDIVAMIKTGDGAFGSSFTDEETVAVAMYIRTLTFSAPLATPTTAPATETPVSAEAGTPSAETTPIEGTQAEVTPEAIPGFGNISGILENKTGADLPSDLKITLRGYEHGADANAGPQEILTLETIVNSDGSYTFESVEVPENRIFLTEVELNGIQYQSEFLIIKPETSEFTMTPITLYGTTEDYSVLKVDALQIYFDYANENDVQIIAVYSVSNPTDKAVIVKVDASQEIPFIKLPAGVTNMGYEASQDSASFISLADGFAMPPTTADKPYGLIALATVAKDKTISIEQPVVLPVEQVMLLVPSGVTAEGSTLTNNGPHDFQGSSFDLYSSTSLNAGDTISFTLSGKPASGTAVNADLTQNQTLLIGIGALGLALIIAGGWLYWRDSQKSKDSADDEEDDEYEDAESVLDAIVAIDDLHRAGKISDEAYQKRRAELKNSLKKKG